MTKLTTQDIAIVRVALKRFARSKGLSIDKDITTKKLLEKIKSKK